RRGARAVGRHRLDGEVLPQHARDRSAARATRSKLRGRRAQVLRALRLDRERHAGSLGRSRRLLLRPSAPSRRYHHAAARPLDRGARSAVRRRAAGEVALGEAHGFPATRALVPEQQAEPGGLLEALRERRPSRADHAGRRGAPAPRARAHARRVRVPLALRAALAVAPPPRAPARTALRRQRGPPRLRAGRVAERALRRQLELARADLAALQLPGDRIAAPPARVDGQRLHGRDADRLGQAREPPRGGRRDRAPAGVPVPARRQRQDSSPRRERALPARSGLARPAALLRVFPRRQRRGPRRLAPDRLDGALGSADREPAPAIRRRLTGSPRMTANRRLTEHPTWQALAAHHREVRDLHLRKLFADDPKRGERMTAEGAGLYLDYSKNRITDETIRLLIQLAAQRGVAQRRDAMFAGGKINSTEKRAGLHRALRAPRGTQIKVDRGD